MAKNERQNDRLDSKARIGVSTYTWGIFMNEFQAERTSWPIVIARTDTHTQIVCVVFASDVCVSGSFGVFSFSFHFFFPHEKVNTKDVMNVKRKNNNDNGRENKKPKQSTWQRGKGAKLNSHVITVSFYVCQFTGSHNMIISLGEQVFLPYTKTQTKFMYHFASSLKYKLLSGFYFFFCSNSERFFLQFNFRHWIMCKAENKHTTNTRKN